jgi:tape measure domain-containing protein
MPGLSFDFLIRDKGSKSLRNIGDEAQRATFKLRGVSMVGSGISRFGVTSGKALGVATLAVGGLGVAAVGMGLKTAAAMEQAKISFTTMLGSGDKATSFLKDLQGFAAKTPFEFPELQTAASSLISAGINANKVIPIMTTLGDVTSGMGTGSEGVQRATVALQQMSAAGKITGEDLNQLRDAGIPVFDLLASATGKSKKEVVALAQAGKLGGKELDQLMKALETGKGLERFSGLMEKQSASMSGMWSTLKDTVNMGLANVMGAFQPIISKAMPGIISMSDKMGKSLAGAAQKVIPKIGKMSDAFGALFETGPDASQGFAELMDNAFGNSGKYVSLFRTIGDGVRAAVNGVSGFFAALKGGDVTSDGFVGTMESLGATVKQIFTAAGPQIKVTVGQLMELGRVAAPLVQKAFGIIGDVIGKVIQVVGPIISQIRSTLLGAFKEAAPQISAAMTQIREIIMNVLAVIQLAWQKWGPTILAVVKIVFGTLIKVIGPILRAIAGVVKLVMSIIKGDWSGAWNAIKQIASGIWDAIKALIGGALAILKTIFKGPLDWIKKTWEGLWNGVKSFVGGVWEGIKGTARDALKWVVDKFLGFADTIIQTAASAFGWVPGLGPKLKEAASKFSTFRNDVNNALGGIDDEPVTIKTTMGFYGSGPIDSKDRKPGGRIATGGWIRGPGSGTSDDVPMWTSDGEYVVNAKQARKHAALVEAINSDRLPRMAKGGLVLHPEFAGLGKTTSAARRAAEKEAQRRFQKDLLGGGGGSGYKGGKGVERWRGVALQALALAGSPLSWIGSLLRRMNQESGGNPRAINLWDSNAKRGTPSIGLMQTIGPTFNAYAGRLRGRGIYDPLANIYAAIRYANDRYGSAPKGWNRSGGYDRGGPLMPGWTMAYNGTGKPEMVLPPGKSAGGAGVTVNVYVQGGVYGDKRQAGREIADAIASYTAGGGKVSVRTA